MSTSTSIIISFIILLLFLSLFVVKQQTAAIIERFGKFQSIRQSGLQIKIPIIDRIIGRISLRVLQLDVTVETKTSDNVFVKLKECSIRSVFLKKLSIKDLIILCSFKTYGEEFFL